MNNGCVHRAVCGLDYRGVRYKSHQAEVFEGHVRAAVGLCRDARVRAYDLDVQILVSAGNEYLIKDTPCSKYTECVEERNKPRGGHTSRKTYCVCLHDAAVDRAVREGFVELAGAYRVADVGVDNDKLRVALCLFDKGAAVSLPHFNAVGLERINQVAHTLSPASSLFLQ